MDINNGKGGQGQPGQGAGAGTGGSTTDVTLDSATMQSIATAVADILQSNANISSVGSSSNMPNHNLQAIVEAVSKQLQSANSGNSVLDIREQQKKELAIAQENEKNSIKFSDLLSEFKILLGTQAEVYLNSLGNLSLKDRANALANLVIKEAYGDSEEVNAMVASFANQQVFDDTSAFSVKYKDALTKLKEKKSSSFIVGKVANTNGVEISAKELSELSAGLYDYRTKEDALIKAQKIGLIK